jgi:hypothetical protein
MALSQGPKYVYDADIDKEFKAVDQILKVNNLPTLVSRTDINITGSSRSNSSRIVPVLLRQF